MKRKLAWALPLVFALAVAAGALTAHADTIFSQLESVLVADVYQFIESVLSNQPEPVAVTDSVSLGLASQLGRSEPVTVSDSHSFGLSSLFNHGEAVAVTDSEHFLLSVRLTVQEPVTVTDTLPDATPPSLSLTGKPSDPTGSSQASFAWSITDPDDGGGFQSFCKLDTGSLAACSSGVSYGPLGDGPHSFTVNAADPAGNRSTDVSYSFVVDTTPPTMACAMPVAGWHAADQSVACSASDAGSGLANPTDASFALTTSLPNGTETANASTGSHQVCDQAANCATAGPISGIKIDKKTPAIQATAITTGDGKPYSAGTWTNQSVQVSFSCTDLGSGVNPATVSAPVTLGSEGKDQSASGGCADTVGNSTTTSFTQVDIDRTPPTSSYQGQAPPANVYGWNNSNVTLTWNCADALSGVVKASVQATISAEGANQSATATCRDQAGNSAADTKSGINLDRTSPVLIATAATADGKPYTSGTWTNQNVTVTFNCSDALSGVAMVSGPVTISTEGANQSAAGSCSDKAGNSSAAAFSGIDVDRAAPVTAFASQPGPLNGRTLSTTTATVTVDPGAITLGGTCYDSFGLIANLTATDSLSGVATIKYGTALAVSGQPLPNPALSNTISGSTGTVQFQTSGAYVLTYAAVDQAGNQEATQTRWIFVSMAAGISCVTTPVPTSSLPNAGTVTFTATIQIGLYKVPLSFTFVYPSRT